MTNTPATVPAFPRPAADECAPWAATYINDTADALAARGDDDVMALLRAQPGTFDDMLAGRDPSIATHAYAPGKWTLVESLVHVADTERVFAYRLLRIARGDSTPLAGFDQDAWVPESRATSRSLDSALAEFRAVRAATLALIESLDGAALTKEGVASNHRVTARALVWMIAGHAAHHVQITAERYLAEPVGR